MKVAVLGGTGKLGLGLALRLVQSGHDVVMGSRDAAKAEEMARNLDTRVAGKSNLDAATWCDIGIIAVPYQGHRALLEPLREQLKVKIVVDATVPIDPSNILRIKTETGTSAAEEAAALLNGRHVFAAFHTISHRILRQAGVSHDVLVGGGAERKSTVLNLIRDMGLRPIDAGPLEIAGCLERMAALLLSINRQNKVKESGFKVTGVP
ncbi:MAG: NADPH-dependent F420 reductase [Acidobacteriales bacterium]|nr:NADPH-dependent F420 reductase [Terriglobales bacterium]